MSWYSLIDKVKFFWIIIYTHGMEFTRKKMVKVKDKFSSFLFSNHAVVIFLSRNITELLYIKASRNSHIILYQFYSADEYIREIYGLDTFAHLRVIFWKLLLDILSSLYLFDPVNLFMWSPQNQMFRISCFLFESRIFEPAIPILVMFYDLLITISLLILLICYYITPYILLIQVELPYSSKIFFGKFF